jgi:hypothetical protein
MVGVDINKHRIQGILLSLLVELMAFLVTEASWIIVSDHNPSKHLSAQDRRVVLCDLLPFILSI